MPDRPSTLKARIVKISDPRVFVICQFNPQDLSITRKVKWNEQTDMGHDAARLTFAGGEAQDLTIPLLFDTTHEGADVRVKYAALLKLTEVDPRNKNPRTGKSEPPQCRFEWGKLLSFTAVITQVTQKFLMFKANGTPVRAEVSVTFKQIGKIVSRQNPTSHSEARKIWVVSEGERLDWIAYQEYGDAAHWLHIAETNNLTNPRDLRPGQVLKLVPLP